ncbi:hypothetical protein FVE85_3552 [Porphyridium purpureum]|uniref:Uncharacterized protein n=1 Tax=Porphyridium purpureum TaxID=35688 RepID=A0A5J4YN38_PORPP|nr:hypothetical protein FVE85_3552 [Porphyridium purpureum]|eukprot:POR9265..scf249_10
MRIDGYWRDEATGRYYRIDGAPESIAKKMRVRALGSEPEHMEARSKLPQQVKGTARHALRTQNVDATQAGQVKGVRAEVSHTPSLLLQRQINGSRVETTIVRRKACAYLRSVRVESQNDSQIQRQYQSQEQENSALQSQRQCGYCLACQAHLPPRSPARVLDQASAYEFDHKHGTRGTQTRRELHCQLEIKPSIPRNQLQLTFSDVLRPADGTQLVGTCDRFPAFHVFRETYSISLSCPDPASAAVCLGRKDKCMLLTLRERGSAPTTAPMNVASHRRLQRDFSFRSDVLDLPGHDIFCSSLKLDDACSSERSSLLAGSRQGKLILAHLRNNRFERNGGGASWQIGEKESVIDVLWSTQSPGYAFYTSRTCVSSSTNRARTLDASSSDALCMWDLRYMRRPALTFARHVNDFKRLKLFESGEYLISPGSDRCVRTWDTRTGDLVVEQRYSTQPVTYAEMYEIPQRDPSGSSTHTSARLVCSGASPAGCLWLENWKPVLLARHHEPE